MWPSSFKKEPAVFAVAATVAVAVAGSVIFTVAVAKLVLPVIVVLAAKVPVAPLKVKMFLSESNETTVAVIEDESVAVPVTVSEIKKSPDFPKTNNFDLNVKVGGLADCWYSAPPSTIFNPCNRPISVP